MIGDPDWARWGVQAPSAYDTVGDPTRWGARVSQVVPQVAATQIILQSGQILSAQCRDAYSRTWNLVGSIAANYGLWAFPDALGPLTWSAFISVVMGVGQNQITHNINLRAVIAADAPFYTDNPFQVSGQPLLERAFVIPGAMIANAISIQVTHVVQYILAPLPPGDTIVTSLQIAPQMGSV